MGTIRPKGDGWEVRWYEDGRRRSKMVYGTLRDAKRAERDIELSMGSRPRGGVRTVEDAMRRWIEVGGNRKSPTSDAAVAARANKWVYPDPIARMPLEKVTHHTLEAFYHRLEPHLRAGSIKNIRWDLSGALTLAVRDGYLAENPEKKVTYRSPEEQASEVVPPEPAEVMKVLDYLDACEARPDAEVAIAMRFALATGARRGELCGLQWGDIILGDPPAVRIVRNAVYVSKPPRVLLRATKTRVQRLAAIPDAFVERLEGFQDRWCTHPDEIEPAAPILRGRGGGHLNPNRLDWRFARALDACGVKFRLHDLRHLVVSVWLAEMRMHDVSRQIGHLRVSTTVDAYGHHLGTEVDRRGADAMSRLIRF